MSETRATLEVIAPTIDEAIEKGLVELGLPPNAVEVEVLDEGSRGLLGIGSRQARVRLSIKPQAIPEPEEEMAVTLPETTSEAETLEEVEQQPEAQPKPDDDRPLVVARETIIELLEKMKIQAEVDAYYGEPSDSRSRIPLHVDISGDDLSILIGKRAETLNALQYIASLIVSKELGRSIPLVVDVEGYRRRRETQLRQLAHRIAEQVMQTNRSQALEPMPSNERRIIHIELRNDPYVYTESLGEGNRRKVVIYPKD